MTAEECLAKLSRPVVPYPATGTPLYHLRGLSARSQIEIREYLTAHPEAKYYQLIFVNGVVDAEGNRILANDHATQIDDGLGGIVENVVMRVMELSGLGAEDDAGKAPSPATTN